MGSSQTLDQASPGWDLDGISTHPALQQRTAHAQPRPGAGLPPAQPRLRRPRRPPQPHGHQALRDREAALSAPRVAVASSRENGPNPVMWLAGQDYRAAHATRTARLARGRSRRGPERLGPEREPTTHNTTTKEP